MMFTRKSYSSLVMDEIIVNTVILREQLERLQVKQEDSVRHYVHRKFQKKSYFSLYLSWWAVKTIFNGLIFIDKFCFVVWTIKNIHSRFFLSCIFFYFKIFSPEVFSFNVIPLQKFQNLHILIYCFLSSKLLSCTA